MQTWLYQHPERFGMLKTAKSLINEKIIESQEIDNEMKELRLKVLADKRREIIQYKTAYIEFVSVVEVEPEIIPKKSKDLLKSKKYIISKIPIVLQTVVHENFEIFLCRYLDLEAKTKKDCKAAIKELLNN